MDIPFLIAAGFALIALCITTTLSLVAICKQPWAKFIPLGLAVSGLCLAAGGLLYDLRFTGVSYQNSSLQMRFDYAQHASIGSHVMRIGIYLLAAGLLALPVLAVLKKKEPNQSLQPTGPSARG